MKICITKLELKFFFCFRSSRILLNIQNSSFFQFLGGFAEPGKNMQYNQQAPPPQQMMAPPVQNVVVMNTPVHFGQDPVSQKQYCVAIIVRIQLEKYIPM